MTIPPTYYRSKLQRNNLLETYKKITHSLITKKYNIVTSKCTLKELENIVQAVHFDHPEIFWVDFWNVKYIKIETLNITLISFSPLSSNAVIVSCQKRLIEYCKYLEKLIAPQSDIYVKLKILVNFFADKQIYCDSNNAFWGHTIIGPLLLHMGVCEGLSKLFLLSCQFIGLPCYLIRGFLNNNPHAWNAVEVNGMLLFIDITKQIGNKTAKKQCFNHFLQNKEQLLCEGYIW